MTADLIGRVLDGRLRIERPLGKGGMGEVYLARDLEGGAECALKLMWADPRRAESTVGRFHREAQALARLTHPGIVRVIGAGESDDGLLYLQMEYVRGQDLEQVVGAGGPLALARAVGILRQIAEALAYAHEGGVVHRDLKPSNILLADATDDAIKIIDFGLARIISDHTLTVITTAHAAVGTPLYMAPEQFLAGEIGPAVDVYGLAGLAYFLLTARPVFPARSKTEVVLAHCRKTPPRLTEITPELKVPGSLESLLLQCLSKKAEERPTASSLHRTLVECEAEVRQDPALMSRVEPSAAAGGDAHDGVGELIWSDSQAGQGGALGISRERLLRDGLQNQITNLVVELSLALSDQAPEAVDLRERVAEIEQARTGIDDLEIELALLDSSDDLGGGVGGGAARRRFEEELARRLRALNQCYRQLYQELHRLRDCRGDEHLERLYLELDGLVRQFIGASSG